MLPSAAKRRKDSAPAPLVCCADFSADARRAADVAAAISLTTGSPLTLLHVAKTSAAGNGAQRLRNETTRLRSAGAAVRAVLLRDRQPAAAIGSYLAAHPAALAVVSSSNKRTLDRWKLGSVSESIAESSRCPTLVVRQPAPLLAWALDRSPLKIFAAIGSGVDGACTLNWLAAFARIAPTQIVLAHVNWPPHAQLAFGGSGPILRGDNAPEVQHMLHRDFEQKARGLLGANLARIVIQPSWGRKPTTLLRLAHREHAQLFVTGAHQWHGLQRLQHASVSRALLRHAPMNIVCVPGTAAEASPPAIPRFQRVLVTTDFSPLANSAVPYAYALLAPAGMVKLLHVIPPSSPANPLIANYRPRGTTPGRQHVLLKQLRHRLRDLIPRQGIGSGVASNDEIVRDNDVAKAICREAARFGADAICLASHGRGGVARALLGSVAQAVVCRSHCPVLVVRPNLP